MNDAIARLNYERQINIDLKKKNKITKTNEKDKQNKAQNKTSYVGIGMHYTLLFVKKHNTCSAPVQRPDTAQVFGQDLS